MFHWKRPLWLLYAYLFPFVIADTCGYALKLMMSSQDTTGGEDIARMKCQDGYIETVRPQIEDISLNKANIWCRNGSYFVL